MKDWVEIFLEVARRKRATQEKRQKKQERRRKQIARALKQYYKKRAEREQHPLDTIKDEDDAEEPA